MSTTLVVVLLGDNKKNIYKIGNCFIPNITIKNRWWSIMVVSRMWNIEL